MAVLISGATGYIAQHIVDNLLKENYKVIGTVRSESKAEKLKNQFGNNPNFITELVPDIAAPNAFDDVLRKHAKDVKVILHTASPFHFETKDVEKDLLIPAVNGTKSILESVKKYGANTVERVVITSSYAAIFDLARVSDKSVVFTEDSWNPATWKSCQVDPLNAYCGSKKFAEKAAWDFYEENKNLVKFKLSVVNPVYVYGPQMFDEDVTEHLNTSCEIINSLMHAPADLKLDENLHAEYIDVRDVARAHLLAFQKEEAIGQRLGLCGGKFDAQDLVDILNEDFPQLKGKIPTGDNPGHGASVTNSSSTFDNTRSKKILGFKFKTLKESVHDTAAQILKKEGRL